LPSELEKAVSFTKTDRKKFIEDNCVLFAELIPLNEKKPGIVVFSGLLPKAISDKLEEEMGEVPDFFMALPYFAFDKNEACIFLTEKNLCGIYEARPKQCELFPALSVDNDTPLHEQYDYCELAKSGKPELDEEHLNETKHYFSSVEGNGFSRVWFYLPRKAIVKIGEKEFVVSREDFLGLLGPYA